jgi:hypothetical protein
MNSQENAAARSRRHLTKQGVLRLQTQPLLRRRSKERA